MKNKKIPKGKRVQAFLHSGSLGDVIWSLPFIISKQGGDLYLRDYNDVSATNQNNHILEKFYNILMTMVEKK